MALPTSYNRYNEAKTIFGNDKPIFGSNIFPFKFNQIRVNIYKISRCPKNFHFDDFQPKIVHISKQFYSFSQTILIFRVKKWVFKLFSQKNIGKKTMFDNFTQKIVYMCA